MAETKYDVFISYRRKGGAEKAELLKAVFEKRGYPEERIFMDTHALKGGDFTLKLKDAITASTNVIVLITKGCFDQIKEDDFWVYEISQALEQHKNIIPVYFDGIKQIDGKELPEVLKHLPYQNAVSYVHEYADASYDKICSFMIKEDNSIDASMSPPNTRKKDRGFLKLNLNFKGCSLSFAILFGVLTIIAIPYIWEQQKPQKQYAEILERKKVAIKDLDDIEHQISLLEAQIAAEERRLEAENTTDPIRDHIKKSRATPQDKKSITVQAPKATKPNATPDKDLKGSRITKEERIQAGCSDEVVYKANNIKIANLRKKLSDLKRQQEDVRDKLDRINELLGEQGKDNFLASAKPSDRDPNVVDGQNPGKPRDGKKHSNHSDARVYFGSIYRLQIEDIIIEDRDGVSHRSNISTNEIDCGCGFITPSSAFVTARQNIQPWIFVDANTPATDWRRRLAAVFALGNDIIISYSAYSTDGPAAKLMFNSRDFSMPTGGDVMTTHIEITEEDILYFEGIGLTIDKKRLLKEGLDIVHATASARAWVALPGTGRAGIPTDAGASNSIAGGQSLDIVYYATTNVQNLGGNAEFFTAITKSTDNRGGTIRLQSGPSHSAFGAPVFILEEDGALMVVGMYVGNNRVVPIHSLP